VFVDAEWVMVYSVFSKAIISNPVITLHKLKEHQRQVKYLNETLFSSRSEKVSIAKKWLLIKLFFFSVFMAEEGIGCVEDHRGDIISCLNSSVPEFFSGNFQKTNWILFDQSHCRYTHSHTMTGILLFDSKFLIEF
jgi:hypothetical protein